MLNHVETANMIGISPEFVVQNVFLNQTLELEPLSCRCMMLYEPEEKSNQCQNTWENTNFRSGQNRFVKNADPE